MPLLTSLTDRVDRFRRRLLWRRRPLAAVAAAGAAYAAVHAVTAPPPPTVGVWTAARDLSPGVVLQAGDLVRRPFTPQSVPTERVQAPADVVGRVLARPLGRGAVVTGDAVVGGRWLAHRPGTAAVPVRLTDPAVVPLLRVGDTVTLVAVDPQGRSAAQVLAPSAQVLAVPAAAAAADGAQEGRLVVVGVPVEQAETVAAEATRSFVTVRWGD